MVLETQEGITAILCNAHSRPDTRGPSDCTQTSRHPKAIGTCGTRRIVQLHEPIIKSYGGYVQIYGPRVTSPTMYLAHQWRTSEDEAHKD